MQTLLFFDPGHFHAALLLRQRNPGLRRQIHVYAPAGPDLDKFLQLIEGFNSRPDDPTNWRLECHIADDALSRLIAERRGECVVLAGKNAPKLARMRRLHDADFHVLADKPWITRAADLADLEAILAAPPVVLDIMTARHDGLARLRHRVMATVSVFGRLGPGSAERPALQISSRHHLLKLTDGKPLERPAWYYDVAVQGDGLVDIQSHMVDQAQWLISQAVVAEAAPGAPDEGLEYARDVELLAAERSNTAVDLALFRESTGAGAFPENLAGAVKDEVLQLACNGQIDYRLAGIHVRQRAEWGAREALGGGDLHGFIARGSGASLELRHGAATGYRSELHLCPNDPDRFEDQRAAALTAWRQDFPGLELVPSELGWRFILPAAAELSHEAQFARVLEDFLQVVESGSWSPAQAGRIRLRYTLLAQAQALAAQAFATQTLAVQA